MWLKKAIGVTATLLALSDAAHAVIVLGPQGQNASAPGGALAGSGWDLQGRFGDYLGTPISSDWFITAAHIFQAGPVLTLSDGDHYLTGSSFHISGTDLTLWQVTTPFSTYATLYNPAVDAPLSTSDRLAVFGRGTDRGVTYGTHGWAWGAGNHTKTWGTNTYDGLAIVTPADVAAGSPYAVGTSFLYADFDNNADPNEATLSVGDSGGGVFVQRNGMWKLVGINSAVDLFREMPGGSDLPAAVYDARGLYGQDASGNWVYYDPALPGPVTQNWYASYIPDSLGRIIASPIPEPAAVAWLGVASILFRRRRV